MIAFSATVNIAAAPSAVWAVMTDLAREPEWMRAVGEVSFVGNVTSYEAGARMQRRGHFLWITMSWESEIVAYEPGTLAVFKHVAGSLKGESRWEIDALVSGCRVTLASTGPAPGLFAMFPALARAGGRAGLKGDLARLKKIVEAAPRANRD